MLSETKGRGSSAEAILAEKIAVKAMVKASKEKMLEVVKLLDFWGITGQPRAILGRLLKTDSEEGR